MKNKILLIVVIILAIVYGIIRSFKKETSYFFDDNIVTIKDFDTNEIETFEMEEYLVGVIAGEMPASFDEEALKAQAIASRTYAYHKIQTSTSDYDLTTDNSTQVYINEEQMKEKWQNDYGFYLNKIKNAIKSTTGLVMTYNNKIIPAYYFAMSNGYTEDGALVFGEDKTYLTSVESREDINNHNYKVTVTFAKNEFCNKLSIDCESIIIGDIQRSKTNRINSITINNKKFLGTEVRKLLDLRSTDFTILITELDVLITTFGYGHGVGMSQYGANMMAKSGADYVEILTHYYTDVKIQSINSIK